MRSESGSIRDCRDKNKIRAHSLFPWVVWTYPASNNLVTHPPARHFVDFDVAAPMWIFRTAIELARTGEAMRCKLRRRKA